VHVGKQHDLSYLHVCVLDAGTPHHARKLLVAELGAVGPAILLRLRLRRPQLLHRSCRRGGRARRRLLLGCRVWRC
jgi:hypothetical protein